MFLIMSQSYCHGSPIRSKYMHCMHCGMFNLWAWSQQMFDLWYRVFKGNQFFGILLHNYMSFRDCQLQQLHLLLNLPRWVLEHHPSLQTQIEQFDYGSTQNIKRPLEHKTGSFSFYHRIFRASRDSSSEQACAADIHRFDFANNNSWVFGTF